MRTKKHLGQNFLIDQNIISKIIKFVIPKKDENFLEIGPGQGALTNKIISKVNYLDAVEIDKELIPFLSSLEKENLNLRIHNESILNFNLNKVIQENHKIRLIGNLPYNISSPILLWALSLLYLVKDVHFMFQKEFAQRLVASPGNKTYGRLSVITQYLTDVELLFSVEPECFKPAPDVHSSFIKITPKKNVSFDSPISKTLQKMTHLLFSKRRKMIGKTLKTILPLEEIEAIGIEINSRPEEISVEEFVKLACAINSK